MKNILLTGAGGFIGKHLLNELKFRFKEPEFQIIVSSSKNILDHINVGDIKNLSRKKFFDFNIQHVHIVIHAGSYTPKSGMEANNISKCLENITTTDILINSLPSLPEKFIYLSTLDVYQNNGSVINENTAVSPTTFYGWSKLFSEKLLEFWASSNNVTLQVLRLGHIYGSGEEKYQKIIPLTIRRLLLKEQPLITTSGSELRSFLHVSDCVRAICKSVELDEYVGPVNIVSTHAYSVLEIVKLIMSLMGSKDEPKVLNQIVNTRDFIFDNSKMVNFLTDERIPISEGLKEEISNFKL